MSRTFRKPSLQLSVPNTMKIISQHAYANENKELGQSANHLDYWYNLYENVTPWLLYRGIWITGSIYIVHVTGIFIDVEWAIQRTSMLVSVICIYV